MLAPRLGRFLVEVSLLRMGFLSGGISTPGSSLGTQHLGPHPEPLSLVTSNLCCTSSPRDPGVIRLKSETPCSALVHSPGHSALPQTPHSTARPAAPPHGFLLPLICNKLWFLLTGILSSQKRRRDTEMNTEIDTRKTGHVMTEMDLSDVFTIQETPRIAGKTRSWD